MARQRPEWQSDHRHRISDEREARLRKWWGDVCETGYLSLAEFAFEFGVSDAELRRRGFRDNEYNKAYTRWFRRELPKS